jgi:hypothetical protein
MAHLMFNLELRKSPSQDENFKRRILAIQISSDFLIDLIVGSLVSDEKRL